MAEDKQALLQYFREMRTELLAAIDGLSPEQMTEYTLDGWCVKDHLLHLAVWDTLRAQEVMRISGGQDSAWRMSPEQDEAFNNLLYEVQKGLSLKQALWESATSYDRLVMAIESASPRGLDASLYGEAGLVSGHMAQHAGWIRRWRDERNY